MGNVIRKSIGFFIGNSTLAGLARFVNRKKLLILYYHRVIVKEELAKSINIENINMYTDINKFERQMEFLKRHYCPVSEERIALSTESGRLPDYSVWVTFDDGWRDNYTNALPILKKYDIPATFFVTTGYINKTITPKTVSTNDIFMNWQEIKEAAGSGISIGVHTISHRILPTLSDEELEREIAGAKNEIEQRLGRGVISFAYPVGKKGDCCLEKCVPILKKNNFKLAVTTIGGFNRIVPERDYFNLKRIGLSYADTLNFFKFKITLGSFWQR